MRGDTYDMYGETHALSAVRRPRAAAVMVAIVGAMMLSVLMGHVASASAAGDPCPTTPVNAAPVANPFGANVTIFDASESVATINAALNVTARGVQRQFFFLPGTYGTAGYDPTTATTADPVTNHVIQAQVASGTKVSGLGAGPCDVVINGALDIQNGGLAIRDSQMSNLTINPIEAGVPVDSMLWASSQTATWRRINLLGNLYVSPVTQTPGACQNPCPPGLNINVIPGVSNGFEITNSNITGNVINGDGLNRPGVEGNGGNSDVYYQQDQIGGTVSGFGSDTMFAGTIGAPADNFGPGTVSPYSAPGDKVTVDTVPVIRELPYIYYDGSQFQVFSPSAQFNVRGPNWGLAGQGTSLPLSSFYIANPTTPTTTGVTPDTATMINTQLSAGKNIILNPGTYVLDGPLTVTHPDQVIFGLGDGILRADNTATIVVKDSAPGTVLGGFQANGRAFNASDMGPFAADQVVIGDTPHGAGSKTDPTSLNDVSSVSGATTDFLLNQDYVIMDQAEIQTNNNSGAGYTTTNWTASDGNIGVVVNGDHNTWQGIWLEHFKQTEAVWNGESGQVLFLENEKPLTIAVDFPAEIGLQPHVWNLSATFDGYPVLAVAPSVNRFTLDGFQTWNRGGNGSYANTTSNITTPVKPGVTFHGLFSGMILGSSDPNTTLSGGTIGGAFNMVNNDGVAATTPNTVGPANATSAWPYSDVAGHAVTARERDYPVQTATVSGTVPGTLGLALPGGTTSLGSFVPGVTDTYSSTVVGSVTSTAGAASLTIGDPSSVATGHLVNGTFSLPQALQADASSAGGTGGPFAPVGSTSTPTLLETYSNPVSNDVVTVGFKQLIGATDALRTGTYSKTLTLTLSTTTP
jgi:hypothetical protein